jgi:hypothetical protein
MPFFLVVPSMSSKNATLPKSITAVNSHISASHETTRITRKENRKTIQIINSTQTLLGSQTNPDLLLGIEGWDPVQSRVHVAGADRVHTYVVFGPFSGQGFAELYDAGFGGVVARLLLGVVHDAAGHGSNEDDGAGLASCDHGLADGLRHQERASQVDVDETAEHAMVIILSLDVGTAKC